MSYDASNPNEYMVEFTSNTYSSESALEAAMQAHDQDRTPPIERDNVERVCQMRSGE